MRTINLGSLAFALVLSCGVAVAKDEPAAALKQAFAKVPVAEVPAKAADMVALTKASERDTAAAEIVKVALQKSPAIAPAIVGAISTKSPDTAPTAAATAAGIQPKQVKLIVQAATSAAPAKAGEIVKAVCKAVPQSYREIALAAAAVTSKSEKEILAGVSEALPILKLRIDQAVTSYAGAGSPSVATILDRVSAITTTAAVEPPALPARTALSPARGPAVGPPYIPLSGTPTYLPPGGGAVPPGDMPGGRDYTPP